MEVGSLAAGYDGSIRINTKLDRNGFNQGLNAIAGSLKKLGGAMGVAFGVTAMVKFGKEAMNIASDLTEVQNVVETAFGTMSSQVDAWAKNSIKQFGMSELAAKRMASTYMAMNAGMGLNGQGAADMAMRTAERAADISSFYNKSIDESDTMLKSIWTGETESLKQIGVVMTQTNLDAYALANGFGKTTQQMTQSEQVMLRYQYVMNQTRLAAGDFVKTQDSWANQTRILSEQWKQFLGIIGQGLIQVLTPALKFLNQMMGVLIQWAQTFTAITGAIFGKQQAQANASAAAVGNVADASNAAADGQNALAGATKKAGKEAKGALASFDQLNVLERSTADTGAASGAGAATGVGTAVAVPALEGEIGANVKLSPNVQHVIDTFKGFIDGLKVAAQPTKDAIQALWGELQRLGSFVWSGLQDFYNEFLKPVGTWVLGEGVPRLVNALKDGLSKVDWGKINGALDRLWKALAPFAVNVGDGLLWFWENVLVPIGTWTMNNAVPTFLDLLSSAIEVLNSVLTALKPLAQWLWDRFLQPLAEWTGGVIVSVLGGMADALTRISDWASKHGETVRVIAVGIGVAFGTWKTVELLAKAKNVVAAFSLLQQIHDLGDLKYVLSSIGHEILPKLSESLSKIVSPLSGFKKHVVDTVAAAKSAIIEMARTTAALAKLAVQWTVETAKKIASTAATWAHQAATAAATAATWLFNAAMTVLTSPITLVVLAIGALIAIVVLLIKNWDTVKAKAIACWNKIKEAWNKAGDWFHKHVTEPISNFFSGLWDGIKGAFTKAFDFIKKAFKGYVNGWITMVESFINFFVNGINFLIKGINKLSFDIPEWFPVGGGSKFGFDIPVIPKVQIPRLAQGAVIPPNQQFAAILGDQKHGRNLEAPEGLIRQIVREETGNVYNDVLRAINNSNLGKKATIMGDVIMDGQKVGRLVAKPVFKEGNRAGYIKVKV